MMTFATQHAQVRLLLDKAPTFAGLNSSYQDVIDLLNGLAPKPGFFVKEYSPAGTPDSQTEPRRYLTAENAAKLDAINARIGEWHASEMISPIENSLLRHDLVMAVNRVANIAGTYGHYRSSFGKSAMTPIRLTPTKFVEGYRTDHVVLQGKAEELAHKLSADVCYIDPPYMKRQYAANYHLIETVARGDEPEAIGVSGLRPWRDQYSVFCTRTRIQNAFREIIGSMDCSTFLVSYSSDGLLSEEELTDVFSPLGEVGFERRPFPRFRSNQSSLGPTVTELLITIQKRQSDSAQVRSA
jgi:adenine-specific DNA-methyltransferase